MKRQDIYKCFLLSRIDQEMGSVVMGQGKGRGSRWETKGKRKWFTHIRHTSTYKMLDIFLLNVYFIGLPSNILVSLNIQPHLLPAPSLSLSKRKHTQKRFSKPRYAFLLAVKIYCRDLYFMYLYVKTWDTHTKSTDRKKDRVELYYNGDQLHFSTQQPLHLSFGFENS